MKRRPINSYISHLIWLSVSIFCLVSLTCQTSEFTTLPEISRSVTDNCLYTFTNKVAGFYLGNSHRHNSVGHEGWTVDEKHYLKDYRFYVNDSLQLRDSLISFQYLPDCVIRTYANGVTEKFTLLDTIDAILIEIKQSRSENSLTFEPLLHREISQKNLRISDSQKQLTVSPDEFLPGGSTVGFRWMCCRADFKTDNSALFILVLDSTENSAKETAAAILNHYKSYSKVRQDRLLKFVQRNNLITNIPEITDAVTWAQISLDALITEQRGKGIWAGLPWFNNYWGRDTFISFTGALLVNGNFEQARDILSAFARFQLRDENDSWYGRIPNRVTNQEIIYNTADGTWWFIREVYEYLLYSGDSSFISEIFPVVQHAIEGALRYRVDKYFFLTHDDADTWMDAKAPSGPWSPRGNRAVEIQALWYTALQVGARLAIYNQESKLAEHWLAIATTLRENFSKFFWNDFSYQMYDHINTDGSSDKKVRPNQIFSIFAPRLPGLAAMIPRSIAARVTSTVLEKLTYRYGVASLWQADRDFHPWHHYPPYYVPDAAYHNGLVWTWLTGPVISSVIEFGYPDLAFQLYYNEALQILNRDAIGNYSELLEALPRQGANEPRVSGTVSQAWSLAEYARNFYQDFIGFRPNSLDSTIHVFPAIPEDLTYISTNLYFRSDILQFEYKYEESIHIFEINRIKGDNPFRMEMIFAGYSAQEIEFNKAANSHTFIFFDEDRRSFTEFGQLNWYFTQPHLKDDLKSLHNPGYPVLNSFECYFSPEESGQKILSARDATGDDHGSNGSYLYPRSHHFPPGIFDITGFDLYDLDDKWGFVISFNNLYDPNWHPEYGFQLTYIAVTINNPFQYEKGLRKVGREAHYTLSAERALHDQIYIGGGFEILDRKGSIKAQMVPDNSRYPIGFVNKKQIRFKVPKIYLPNLSDRASITILSGGQDDHGGAGIGEFRAVLELPGEWHGGGANISGESSRIYDILEIN